ncbi:MAG: hypothetical protein ACE5MI_11315 [Acidimicrobiia bacterium]
MATNGSGSTDPPLPDNTAAQRRETAVLIASLVVLAVLAAVAIGFFASRDTQKSGPLSWEAGGTLDLAFLDSVVEFDGSYLAFGADFDGLAEKTPGVRAYRSDDGRQWSDLGVVIARASLFDVASTGDQILAVGAFHESPIHTTAFSMSAGAPAVWTSGDGTSWERHDLPFKAEPGIDYAANAQAVAATEERAVVFGSAHPDVESVIEAAIPGEYRDLLGSTSFSTGMGGPPFSIQIHAPLGITIFSATFEELGVAPEVTDQFFMGPGDAGGIMWTSDDLRSWDASDSLGGEESIHEVVLGPRGEFIAHGYGLLGPLLWTSRDGLSWETTRAPEGIGQIAVFGNQLIATNDSGFGSSELIASSDAETWKSLTPTGLFSDDIMWHFGSLSASSYGIVAVAMGYAEEPFVEMEPPSIVITKGDITVTHDEMHGLVVVSRGDESLLEVSTWMEQVPDQVAFDAGNRTMTFVNPDSGEDLVTVTFEEIEAAQQEAYGQFEPMRQESLVVFSPDGQQWTTQSAVDIFGVETLFTPVFAFEDVVFAAVQAFGPEPVFDPAEYVPPPTQIWRGIVS